MHQPDNSISKNKDLLPSPNKNSSYFKFNNQSNTDINQKNKSEFKITSEINS